MTSTLHTDSHRVLTAALVEARRSSGMTQQQVADRLGRPQSYVAKIEGSERRLDVIEFIEFARAIGAEPADLFARLLTAVPDRLD